MSSILDDIVRHKREELRLRMKEKPLRELMAQVKCSGLQPRGFRKALERPRDPLPVIAELKKSSPSRGVIKEAFDVKALAGAYATHGASALSVLTDERYFGGELKHLGEAREACDIPLLRKDFIFNVYQVYETVAWGGDAVLLIADILKAAQLIELKKISDELLLDTLIEVHEDEGLEKIASFKDAMIGINNRNLRSFKVDLKTTARLAPRLAGRHFLVSESGIQTHEDLLYLKGLGVKAVLVGESLMTSSDPGHALKKLLGNT